MRVSLIGNPNTGKTTLFNTLTSSNEHVGNWHGVTVEQKSKMINWKGEEIEVVDLPGIYSLSRLSFEEKVATDYLLSHQTDFVINICDYKNIERNLYLTLGLLELNLKVIIVVNQIERKKFRTINLQKLAGMLGVPIISVDASNKKSVEKLKDKLVDYNSKPLFSANKLPYLDRLNLQQVAKLIPQYVAKNALSFYAIKLLEDDKDIKDKFSIQQTFGKAEEVAKCRYDYIDFLFSNCASKSSKIYGESTLDKVLLNKFLALPIFLLIMALVFYLTFFLVGSFLSDLLALALNNLVANPVLSFLENAVGNTSWIYSLFENAIFGGVLTVLSFLPQVALLFLFLSILEDSGYLSRVAFVFEDILSKVGLSGKSVYTLLMGFGCSTSAILTARNMEDKNAKIKTALLTPYMSCSAKFPIYVCLGGAFFGASNIFVIMGLYLLGVVVAVAISLIFEKTILKSKQQSFILEFPPYRPIRAKEVLKVLYVNTKEFLVRVGTLIITMNVIVWLLSSFSFSFEYLPSGQGGSMLEKLGIILSPLFVPLGFGSWGLVSALIAGLIAKEVIVSSIALFSGAQGGQNEMISALYNSASAVYFASGASVLSYLVFCLLYFPCLSSVSVLSKEIGKKWTFFGVVIEFFVAYFLAMIVYNIALMIELGLWWKVLLFVAGVVIILLSIYYIVKVVGNKKNCKDCSNHCTKKKFKE